jgi:mono/diheme cytochrome c family protein
MIAAALFTSALLLGLSALTAAIPAAADEIVSSIVRGGRLYDNWYKETSRPAPTISHPAYPADGRYADEPNVNWRCKECHGWDYAGRDGAYGTGEHYTGIVGITTMVGADPAEIVAVLTDDTHAYGGLLEDADFADLASFVSQGQVDMSRFVDRESGFARGDGSDHAEYFKTICATCHGSDGAGMTTMPPLGRVAHDDPWETLHKILNGHPAGDMPALRVLEASVISDILAYVQGLPAETDILSSIIRGGRLYDNWYEAIGEPAPTSSHPAYPSDGVFAAVPAETWRCTECHGWDYRGRNGAYGTGEHATGIKGIQNMAGADPDTVSAVLRDDTHRFLGVLHYHHIEDLANFVTRGQVDMDRFIERETNIAKGDPIAREAHYTTICANCHGKNGSKFGTLPRLLGNVATNNPWKALHKILNGHPTGEMPALRVFDTDVVAGILAYVQTLPSEDERLASISRGGRLYDKWYAEIGVEAPEQSHPSYPVEMAYAHRPEVNWRCKECHGWDYRGANGFYGSGNHFTGFKGIDAMAGVGPATIIAILKNDRHGFGAVLSSRDLADLANFVSRGQIDMGRYIDSATGVALGDNTRQASYFNAICADCHGKDGTAISTMPPLGRVADQNPWEALHKIRFGQPDEDMAALHVLEMEVLIDILAYAQTLPRAP